LQFGWPAVTTSVSTSATQAAEFALVLAEVVTSVETIYIFSQFKLQLYMAQVQLQTAQIALMPAEHKTPISYQQINIFPLFA
jgi:hypothetical protein